MMILKYLLLCVSSCQLVEGFLNKHWNNDVYTGRQFNDLVTQTQVASPEIMKRAVLVMYAPYCEEGLPLENLTTERLPPPQYMVYAQHDYESSARCVWYHRDYKDRLTERYNLETCLEFLYFDKGGSLLDQPEKYSKALGYGVLHWIWSKLSIQFKIMNNREWRVMIKFRGGGPKMSAYMIEANSEMIMESYASCIMIISCMVTKTFVYGAELDFNDDGTIITLESATCMEALIDVWYNNVHNVQNELSQKTRSWRWKIAETYLQDFKAPVLFPKFTELGYKRGSIPLDLYKSLFTFYNDNIKRREPESHLVEPLVNDSEVKCGMVHLSNDMIKKTADAMLPLIEAWSNVSLEMSWLYGIREYYIGNILRNHVDKVSTHVVSVILQIDKDLGGQPDWELEIIGFDGIRKNVTLQPGEYLFYESATLIHGRPFPYKGNIFANAFLHYRPLHGWKWKVNKNGHWFIFDGVEVEPIDELGTKFMYDKKINLDRFVKTVPDSHDEL